jgi:hypothetical protein
MQTVVQWSDWEGNGLEHCSFSVNNDHSVLEGALVGTRHGHYGAYYFVRTDGLLRTREVRVDYVAGPRMHVRVDENGDWFDLIENRAIASLAGCHDVDIGVTPATNTLAIKRLNLQANTSQDIVVAYVPLLAQVDGKFLPRPARQRYTCLRLDQRYLYEGIFRGFAAELELDEHGLVLDYPETFRRVHNPGKRAER